MAHMSPEHAPLLLPFRDRPLSADDLEALRLVLSTYRDGSGQNQTTVGSMPGFRDFERGLASIVGGSAAENKGVFDVIRPVPGGPGYGVSCKMARFATLSQQAAFAELSNAAAKFRAHLLGLQINWVTEPGLAGRSDRARHLVASGRRQHSRTGPASEQVRHPES